VITATAPASVAHIITSRDGWVEVFARSRKCCDAVPGRRRRDESVRVPFCFAWHL